MALQCRRLTSIDPDPPPDDYDEDEEEEEDEDEEEEEEDDDDGETWYVSAVGISSHKCRLVLDFT